MGRDLVDLFLLAACWACTLSASTLLTEVGPLAAQEFGASDAISPFAVGSFLMGAALSSVPSAALFDCAGRRGGFLLGCMLTVVASALGVTATLRRDAALVFCATFFAGLAQGIGQFYRFAAMEVCAPSRKPFAVTLVLTGGVVAAFVGPELAQRTATVFGEERKYLCSFLAVGVIGLINATVCVLVAFAPPARIAQPLLDSASGLPQPVARTPLLKLMLQPKCVLAVSIATLAHTSMVMLMSPIVIAMRGAGFAAQAGTWTLEAHFFSMFAPGFVTGKLIGRLGPIRVSFVGIAMFGATAAVLLAAQRHHGTDEITPEIAVWMSGMALCGLAWNLCFSAGTVMLSACYDPADASRVQGANDFVIFAIAGAGSFGSGYIYRDAGGDISGGWHTLVFVVIGLMCLLLLLLLGMLAGNAMKAEVATVTPAAAEPPVPSAGGERLVSRSASALSVLSASLNGPQGSPAEVDLVRASVNSEAAFVPPKAADVATATVHSVGNGGFLDGHQ